MILDIKLDRNKLGIFPTRIAVTKIRGLKAHMGGISTVAFRHVKMTILTPYNKESSEPSTYRFQLKCNPFLITVRSYSRRTTRFTKWGRVLYPSTCRSSLLLPLSRSEARSSRFDWLRDSAWLCFIWMESKGTQIIGNLIQCNSFVSITAKPRSLTLMVAQHSEPKGEILMTSEYPL